METQEIQNARISALEAKVAELLARVAVLETGKVEVKPKKKANRRERTPEEKAEKVRQLRAGKERKRAEREAALEAQAKADAKKDMRDAETKPKKASKTH